MSDFDEALTFNDAESFLDDALEVRFWRGVFSLEVDNPFAGDTETGFGRTCHCDLTRDQAKQLAEFILRKLAETDKP
jgi:hypothetical protein